MSFSFDVKTELCQIKSEPEKACCRRALLYGLLLFGRNFSQNEIVVQTEHPLVAGLLQTLLGQAGGQPRVKRAGRQDGHETFIMSLEGEKRARTLYESYGYDAGTVWLRINRGNLENECCAASFLRGAFLSCGSVVEPKKDYHLEYAAPHLHLAKDLSALLVEQGFMPKALRRKGNYVLYFNESSQIEDILTLMGAAGKSLELMNIKIFKDFRNKANRVTNCETANIDKTVAAASAQIEAIRKILRAGGLELLDEDLRAVAKARMENPEMSLSELARALNISRSGVHHRLRKVMEKAEKMTV